MRFVSSNIFKFNHSMHRNLVFFLQHCCTGGRSNELFFLSTADDIDRLWEILEDNNSMKRLLPSSFEFVNTQYGSAPKRSCIGYHLRTTTLSSGSNRTPQQLDSGKIGHVFPSLPMPTTQKSSADSLKWPIHILDAQALERRTIGQASSEEWQKTHGRTLTASNFRRICCCLNGHENLLKALFDSTDLSRIPAVQHGKKHEAVAVEKYIAIMKERGKCLSAQLRNSAGH